MYATGADLLGRHGGKQKCAKKGMTMTDRVDTDTQSVAAAERDLLLKDVAFWIEQSDFWKRLASDERAVTNRLRAVIEKAPHSDDCEGWVWTANLAQWHDGKCDCWKVDIG